MKHLLLPVLFALLLAPVAQARQIVDPKPPMTWQELNTCELIVVAHYAKHNGRNVLTLKVDRVLRGAAAKAGDDLTIALNHWYSIETGPVGHDIIPAQKFNKPPDGIPKLCYREQLSNPGLDVPVKCVEDVSKPAIYFIKDEASPGLMVQNQVQPAYWAGDWNKLLGGAKPGMLFRLAHDELRGDAVKEMKAARDPKVVEQYVEWLFAQPRPPEFNWTRWRWAMPAEAVLKALGDKDGDVYEPLMKRIAAGDCPELDRHPAGFHNMFLPSVVLRTCARVAPDRTWEDAQRILTQQKGTLQAQWVAASICYTGKTEAIDKAFALLEDPQLRRGAIWSIAGALSSFWWQGHDIPSKEASQKLREYALPLARKALESEKVIQEDKDALKSIFEDLLKGN